MSVRLTKRGVRLGSGLVLFAYVAGHFINHALGLVSLRAAEGGLRVAVAVWQSPLGTLALYGAAAAHVTLAFMAIYAHRTLRLPVVEWIRIAAGLSMPTLLIAHAVDTRLALALYGHPTDYAHVVWTLWHSGREGRQLALLVPGWLHGCLGLGFVFAARAWYPRWRLAWVVAAVMLPVLAVLGFFSMLKEVAILALDPGWAGLSLQPLPQAAARTMGHWRDGMLTAYYAAIVAIFVARLFRTAVERRRGSVISVAYPEKTVRVPQGWSVLEASRAFRIEHASVCGGRARCSTCRVSVVVGGDQCPAPGDDERQTLERIRAAPDVRLACRLRPRGDLRVVPLVSKAEGRPQHITLTAEGDFVVMLVDLRWQVGSPPPLPHDLLHALDRFGRAVEELAKSAAATLTEPRASDRWLLVFGVDNSAADPMRQAVAAAQLDLRLRELRQRWRTEFDSSVDYVVHLHRGPTLVGHRGDHALRTFTATGQAVDVVRQLAARTLQWSTRAEDEDHDAAWVATRPVVEGLPGLRRVGGWSSLDLPDGARLEFARVHPASTTVQGP